MKKLLLLTGILLFICCSRSRQIVEYSQSGDVTIIVALKDNLQYSRSTQPANIRITIHTDNDSLISDTSCSLLDFNVVTISELTEGISYTATVWSEDNIGDTIHEPDSQSFDITAKEDSHLTFQLIPLCGSIIVQLSEIPTSVDSLFLTFIADSGSYQASKKRSARVNLSLDKVPYGAHGSLNFHMTDSNSDTVSHWDTVFTFSNQNISSEFSLVNSGKINLKLIVENSASTVFSSIGNNKDSLTPESGRLLISEFCATGGSSSNSCEFIEIYNPEDDFFHEDTLLITAGSKEFQVTDVNIPAKSYFTISTAAGAFWNPDKTISLDISSTSGMIIISSNNIIHDYLIYFNDIDVGWDELSASAKKSWVLKDVTAEENNSGTSWTTATTAVIGPGEEVWYGTPGTAGK